MKVAINTRMLLPGKLEGLGWYTYEVTRRLVARHPDWSFMLLFDRAPAPAFTFGPHARAFHLPPPARHPWLWHLWYEYSLPWVFARHRPDVFFSPDGFLSMRARVPTAMVLHDLAYAHFPEHLPARTVRYLRRQVPRFVSRAEALLTVSETSRADMARQFGLEPEAIAITGNGARPGFRPVPPPEQQAVRDRYTGGRPYFIYLGSVHPRKNVDRLIEGFDQFKKTTGQDHRLLLAGATAWKAHTAVRAYERARFRDHILRLGYVREAALPGLLGAATALTYVSLLEGFGLPLLEAMQAEVPIITSHCSSMPEVAGDAALLVDPRSAESIALAMCRLTEQPGLADRLVRAGRERRSRYSWERVTEVVEASLIRLHER